MTAAEYQLGRQASQPGSSDDRDHADQEYRAARRRLRLAFLWLAGLVAWGVLSYAATGPASSPQTGASVQDEAVLDGHGKWTGYVPH
jgi:hypothetical protein